MSAGEGSRQYIAIGAMIALVLSIILVALLALVTFVLFLVSSSVPANAPGLGIIWGIMLVTWTYVIAMVWASRSVRNGSKTGWVILVVCLTLQVLSVFGPRGIGIQRAGILNLVFALLAAAALVLLVLPQSVKWIWSDESRRRLAASVIAPGIGRGGYGLVQPGYGQPGYGQPGYGQPAPHLQPPVGQPTSWGSAQPMASGGWSSSPPQQPGQPVPWNRPGQPTQVPPQAPPPPQVLPQVPPQAPPAPQVPPQVPPQTPPVPPPANSQQAPPQQPGW